MARAERHWSALAPGPHCRPRPRAQVGNSGAVRSGEAPRLTLLLLLARARGEDGEKRSVEGTNACGVALPTSGSGCCFCYCCGLVVAGGDGGGLVLS
jgi:hypothetical protein